MVARAGQPWAGGRDPLGVFRRHGLSLVPIESSPLLLMLFRNMPSPMNILYALINCAICILVIKKLGGIKTDYAMAITLLFLTPLCEKLIVITALNCLFILLSFREGGFLNRAFDGRLGN